MKLRLQDIPKGGREAEFALDLAALNERLQPAIPDERSIRPSDYVFSEAPQAKLWVDVDGRTVNISGQVRGRFETSCARCAEPAFAEFDIPVQMILKPHSERARPGEEIEDLQIGFYDGKEFDCVPIVEEFVVLALPTMLLCKPDCKGLCPECGANLNEGPCRCVTVPETKPLDDRFAALRQLKVH